VPRLGQPADQIIKNHFQNTKAFNTTSAGHIPCLSKCEIANSSLMQRISPDECRKILLDLKYQQMQLKYLLIAMKESSGWMIVPN
jgi:hypothetical protein